jgi:peptide/nickel transport system substrate-binding protein
VKRHILTGLISISICAAMLLTACQAGSSGQFRTISVAAPDCTYGGEISRIQALNEFQVRFTLCFSDPAFVSKIANPVFSIQKQDVLDAVSGNSEALSKNVIGTGPYVLSDVSSPSQIILKTNSSYWGTPPRNKQLVISWVDSPFQRLSMLTNNQVDVIDSPDPTDYNTIQNNPNLELHSRPSLNVYYIGFNNTIPPFDNASVRQAIAFGIDRSYILNNFFPTGTELATQFVPPTVDPGHTLGLRWYDLNTGYTQSLLKDAAYDFNQTIEFFYDTTYNKFSPIPNNTAAYIRTKLSEAGVKVVLHGMTTAEFQAAYAAGTMGFFMTSFQASYPDASGFYNANFLGTNPALGVPYPNLASGVQAASKAPDVNIRQTHYGVINRLIKDLAPVIPLAYSKTTIANRIGIENVVAGSYFEDFTDMASLTNSLAFVQQNQPLSYWPGDETEVDTLRIATLLYDTLVKYDYQTNDVKPSLSSYWTSNTNATVWTFDLRYGVKFTNGETLNANDVVASFNALWDASSPNHTGRTGEFTIFHNFFGNFLNAVTP